MVITQQPAMITEFGLMDSEAKIYTFVKFPSIYHTICRRYRPKINFHRKQNKNTIDLHHCKEEQTEDKIWKLKIYNILIKIWPLDVQRNLISVYNGIIGIFIYFQFCSSCHRSADRWTFESLASQSCTFSNVLWWLGANCTQPLPYRLRTTYFRRKLAVALTYQKTH